MTGRPERNPLRRRRLPGDGRAGPMLMDRWPSQSGGIARVLLYQILILALVQGLTEFLPISSSGHLVVTSRILGWPDQGLVLDIAVHLGTLLAVMAYFWRDLGQLVVGLGHVAANRRSGARTLFLNVAIATVPILAVGYLARDWVETALRSVEVIAWATIGFGILLWVADRLGLTIRRIEHVGPAGALMVGLAQVLALVPGTSRSGITMTAARFLGMERTEAARFSMLMSIPVIAVIGGVTGWEVLSGGDMALGLDFAIATGAAFAFGFLAIAVMMAWLKRAGFGIFVVYRILLGAFLLYWAYY